MPLAELPACVFCGRPIAAGEETAGRAPMAAHAACADAALADDEHWDAISAESPDEDATNAEPSPDSPAPGRAGCLTMAALLPVALAVAGLLPA